MPRPRSAWSRGGERRVHGITSAAALAYLAFSASMPAGAEQAAVYRWTDAKGVVHYGEQPPEGVPATAIAPGLGARNVIRAPERESPGVVAPTPRLEPAGSTAGDGDCDAIQAELSRVDSALREGYGAVEGERLKRRQRVLRWQRLRDCGP